MSEKRALRPIQMLEPNCRHPGGERQPASACVVCRESDWLREHRAKWRAWLSENPDSWEAKEVERLVKSGYLERLPDDPPEWDGP